MISFLWSSRTGKPNLKGKYQNSGYVEAEAGNKEISSQMEMFCILTECELHEVNYCQVYN